LPSWAASFRAGCLQQFGQFLACTEPTHLHRVIRLTIDFCQLANVSGQNTKRRFTAPRRWRVHALDATQHLHGEPASLGNQAFGAVRTAASRSMAASQGWSNRGRDRFDLKHKIFRNMAATIDHAAPSW